jgi:hypothetical protein
MKSPCCHLLCEHSSKIAIFLKHLLQLFQVFIFCLNYFHFNTQKEDLEKMVQNPTFQHCTNSKELSKNAQKKCKTSAQKDKELNLRMQKRKEKRKKCTKEKYKTKEKRIKKKNRNKTKGTLQP